MAMFVGCIAVLEYRQQHVLWAGHIPSFLQINDPAVIKVLRGGDRFGKYRAVSTFGTCLGLGEYMALTLPFVLRFATGPYSWLVRGAAAASALFVVFVSVLSGSRVGTVGCLIGITLYGAAWSLLKWRREPSSIVGPAIVASYPIAALVGAATIALVGRLRSMFWGDGSEHYSDQDRIGQLQLGIPKIISHPWGYGVGRGAETLGFGATARADTLTIDNYYLDVALDYGVDGFVVYYGLFLITMYYCAKTLIILKSAAREVEMLLPIVISLATFFIIKSAFSEENSHPLAFMILGMAVALVSRVSPLKGPVAEPQRARSAFVPIPRPAVARLQGQRPTR
jgi:O-antigen ligase